MFIPPEIAYAAIGTLLCLSYMTILSCRLQDVGRSKALSEYLFNGMGYWHSLVSNVGATFSTTYFFGAVMIFGKIVGIWSVLALAVVTAGTLVVYNRILKTLQSFANQMKEDRTNILLWIIQKNEPSAFSSLVAIYAITYFALLVEEIAVSRAVLDSVLAGRPQIAGTALTIILLVIIAYLYAGGFRAVLISDLVQALVLSCFVIMMIHLTVTQARSLEPAPESIPQVIALNVLSTAILGIAWFSAGVDFASRLNINKPSKSTSTLKPLRFSLVALSMLSTSSVLLCGVLFSRVAYSPGAEKLLPEEYLFRLTTFFLNETSGVFKIIFLVSVFCMIFTTIDTLCLALLQIGHFSARGKLSRRASIPVILLASLAASIIKINHLYIFGIFAASLIILPMPTVLRAVMPTLGKFIPEDPIYLWIGFGVTSVTYFVIAEDLVGEYNYQFLFSLIPACTLVSIIILWSLFRSATSAWKNNVSKGKRNAGI